MNETRFLREWAEDLASALALLVFFAAVLYGLEAVVTLIR